MPEFFEGLYHHSSHTPFAAYLADCEGLDSFWARHFWHPSASTRPWTSLCRCVSHGIIISRHGGAKGTFKDTRYVDRQATVYPSKCCSELEIISRGNILYLTAFFLLSYWTMKKITCCLNCSQKSKMVICQWLNTIINWELTFDFFFSKLMCSLEIWSHQHIF